MGRGGSRGGGEQDKDEEEKEEEGGTSRRRALIEEDEVEKQGGEESGTEEWLHCCPIYVCIINMPRVDAAPRFSVVEAAGGGQHHFLMPSPKQFPSKPLMLAVGTVGFP